MPLLQSISLICFCYFRKDELRDAFTTSRINNIILHVRCFFRILNTTQMFNFSSEERTTRHFEDRDSISDLQHSHNVERKKIEDAFREIHSKKLFKRNVLY